MSSIAVSSNASGTGVFTIASPATSTNRTLTLPDSTGTVATAESTLTQFSASGSAPVFASRAWVNFNGTGTVAIRASGNVSSITDNGVGDWTINIATAMSDVNYSFTACGTYAAANGSDAAAGGAAFNSLQSFPPTTTALRGYWKQGNTSSASDSTMVCVAIFR